MHKRPTAQARCHHSVAGWAAQARTPFPSHATPSAAEPWAAERGALDVGAELEQVSQVRRARRQLVCPPLPSVDRGVRVLQDRICDAAATKRHTHTVVDARQCAFELRRRCRAVPGACADEVKSRTQRGLARQTYRCASQPRSSASQTVARMRRVTRVYGDSVSG